MAENSQSENRITHEDLHRGENKDLYERIMDLSDLIKEYKIYSDKDKAIVKALQLQTLDLRNKLAKGKLDDEELAKFQSEHKDLEREIRRALRKHGK